MASQPSFRELINQVLSPSQPVRREELLMGRDDHLRRVQDALNTSGRHVFIYGPRGVGKTSLAQTAAYEHQSSEAEPVRMACGVDSNFYTLVRDMVAALVSMNPIQLKRTTLRKIAARFNVFSGESSAAVEEGPVPVPNSLNQAVELIKMGTETHSRTTVVLIDEFDRLLNVADQQLFGDLVKQLSDQEIPIKLIMSGIGESLEDLLNAHASSYRYFSTVELDRLDFDACKSIVQYAARSLGVVLSDAKASRISQIGDGFPHFVHLIGSKLFGLLEDASGNKSEVQISAENFDLAMVNAAQDVEYYLRSQYDKATKKYSANYQYILWGMAAHPDLCRRSSDIYDSYVQVVGDLESVQAIERKEFNRKMNALKSEAHGSILKASRAGWYEFREPIIRGYCRLLAEQRGVALGSGYYR